MNTKSRGLNISGRIAAVCLTAFILAGSSDAQTLPSAEAKRLTSSAKTPADHLKLAKHYEAVAVKHEAEAKVHEALAE